MTDYRFKLGMYLPELRLPFDEALAKAKDIAQSMFGLIVCLMNHQSLR